MTFWGNVLAASAAALSIPLTSCGIDEYAYLEPVTSVTISQSDSQEVTVKLPASPPQTDYFDEYLLYYKVYKTADESSDVSLIATNKSSVENANENAPTTLESVLTGLSFKRISFGNYAADASADYNFNEQDNPLSKAVDASIHGQSFTIDFNLDSLGTKYPVLTKADDSKYKLMRYADHDFTPDTDRNLSYHASLAAADGDAAVVGEGYARVLLYIVASGHDENFTTIHSTAEEVGVFLLTDVSF